MQLMLLTSCDIVTLVMQRSGSSYEGLSVSLSVVLIVFVHILHNLVINDV